MKQNSLTILVPVLEGKVQALLDQLQEVKNSSKQGIAKELDSLGNIHYARWVVIDHGKSWINDPETRNPSLLFVLDYDGDENALLTQVCESCASILDEIYQYCPNYPQPNFLTTDVRADYLKLHRISDTAVYIGAPGRSVKQIKQERDLRDTIRHFLDQRSWSGMTAKQVHGEIKEYIQAQDRFSFLKSEKVSPPRINYFVLVLLGILIIPLLPILLPMLIAWVLIVHFFYEKKDKNFTNKRSHLDDTFLTNLEVYEDWTNQNQFTQLVDMKEGKVRLFSIKFMFLLTNILIKLVFNQGKLMGIPTIHFAKWVLFDNNSRVLFFSNFDGSWQQYLGDFIDNSGWGLTGIFSNTKVFPKTNFLFTGGAYLEENFLAWSRNSELVTNYWYSAYPDLSIKNVNNNTRIRVRVMRSLSERKAAKFLKLF